MRVININPTCEMSAKKRITEDNIVHKILATRAAISSYEEGTEGYIPKLSTLRFVTKYLAVTDHKVINN